MKTTTVFSYTIHKQAINMNSITGSGPIQPQNTVTTNSLKASDFLSDNAQVSPLQAQLTLKMKKFTFTASYKLLLLKCVCEFDAHRAAHGGKGKHFQKVLVRFVALMPPHIWTRSQKPILETLHGKLRPTMSARKRKVQLICRFCLSQEKYPRQINS